jgi:hypothetical protein
MIACARVRAEENKNTCFALYYYYFFFGKNFFPLLI